MAQMRSASCRALSNAFAGMGRRFTQSSYPGGRSDEFVASLGRNGRIVATFQHSCIDSV